MTKKKKYEFDEELQDLEMKLKATLLPMTPRPEFVNELRSSLMKQTPKFDLILETQNQKLQNGLLITGGVLGGLAMVLAGIRGMVSVVGIVGLLISILKQNSQETPVSSNLAH